MKEQLAVLERHEGQKGLEGLEGPILRSLASRNDPALELPSRPSCPSGPSCPFATLPNFSTFEL